MSFKSIDKQETNTIDTEAIIRGSWENECLGELFLLEQTCSELMFGPNNK